MNAENKMIQHTDGKSNDDTNSKEDIDKRIKTAVKKGK